jgi:diguanylate cyclase (GGDEF)-like protein/PAS domain S-box-containing protein
MLGPTEQGHPVEAVPDHNRDPAGATDDLPDALALAELTSDPIVAADVGGRLVFANAAAGRLFGQSPAHLVGRRAAALLVPWPAPGNDGPPPRSRFAAMALPYRAEPVAVDLDLTSWRQGLRRVVGAVIRPRHPAGVAEALAAAEDRAGRAEAELQRLDRRLRDLVEMLPEAIAVFDAADRYVLWNRKYEALYPEVAPLLAPGIPFVDILRASIASGDMPERVDDPEAWLAWRLAQHGKPQTQDEQQFRDGRWVRHDEKRTADGGVIGVRVDITDLKRREASFRLLFEANPVPMLLADAAGLTIFAANMAAAERYGHEEGGFAGTAVLDLYVPAQRRAAAKQLRAPADRPDDETVWTHRTATGEEIKVLTFVRALAHDGRQALLMALIDVTERVRSEAHITHLAHHDALTGLANRFHFSGRLAAILGQPRPASEAVLLLYIDLDGFKPVNDAYGHAVGDMLLQLVAQRLADGLGDGDLAARIGGDEFALILSARPEAPDRAAGRLLALLAQPFDVDGLVIKIGASIGVAAALESHVDPDRLMAQADTALYRAKAAGRNRWVVFSAGMEGPPQRPGMESDIAG